MREAQRYRGGGERAGCGKLSYVHEKRELSIQEGGVSKKKA